MSTRHLAALLGFAFVAACVALNLGYALLCLIGALGELQDRVTRRTAAARARSAATR